MNRTLPPPRESRWPHRLAVVLVCVTFPLIWVGGLVTSYDAGMAVSDWPTTFGYNLFLYPWTTWLFGPWNLFIEHGHRLLGALAGLITIGLVAVTFRYDSRNWVRWFSVATLAMVIVQGLLGGVRVLLDERQLAMLHGVTGPVFFAMATAMAVFTSRLWLESPRAEPARSEAGQAIPGGKLHRIGLLTVLFAYVQLVIGAQLRHVPVDASPSTFSVAVMFHLFMAAVLLGHVLMLAFLILRPGTAGVLRRPTLTLAGLMLLQIALGVGTWVAKYSWPAWLAGFQFAAAHVTQARGLAESLTVTAHVANGSLILVVSLVVFLRSLRLVGAAATATAKRTLSVGWFA